MVTVYITSVYNLYTALNSGFVAW